MSRCQRRRSFALTGVALLLATHVQAQEVVTRAFPADALRGTLTFLSASEAQLNNKSVGLVPGLRVRGPNNLLMLSGELVGQKFVANYTVDFLGQIKDVWVLREDERARWWPRSVEEAATRVFDPVAQTWSKP